VHAVEQASFADPWSFRDFAETLASGVTFLVAADDTGQVAGFLVARHAADEGEILNVGVLPPHRRRGVARALVAEGLAQLARLGARHAFLEVRESNAGARALYRGFGFAEVARRRGYYRRPVEDAIVLKAAISADLVAG